MNARAMFLSFKEILYRSEPVEFSSDFSLEESVNRLRQVVKSTVFHTLFKQSAVGNVREKDVRLHRYMPFFGNSFAPIFVGKFEATSGHVVLKGAFTLRRFLQLFMTIWFGFAALWTVAAFVVALAMLTGAVSCTPAPCANPQNVIVIAFPLFGVGFIALGFYFIRFSKWLSRGDIGFLSHTIANALTKQGQ